MSAPLALVLEPVSVCRSRWPWAFFGHFGLGLWFGAGLWIIFREPLFVPTWVSATSIVGAWWAIWRGLVALLGAR